MRRRCAAASLVLALAACGRPLARTTWIEGATMGTTYRVQIVDLSPARDVAALEARVAAALRGIEGRMSTYDPDSEVSRFNASGSTGWFPVSADTLAVVEAALRTSRLTDGAFDVTVGPLVELWGFGRGGERRRPPPEEIDAALASVGFRWLETRADPPSIRKQVPGLRIDLSAIAKGFAVDEVARLLTGSGAHRFLVEVGGELRASGQNGLDRPWRVAVERPGSTRPVPPCVLELSGGAVATSGDYRNAFVQDGVRYSHVIDPRAGRPVATGVVSATVLSASALEADAFATALMVLPPDEGLRLAAREGLGARLLVREERGLVERTTPRFPGGPP